jgi:hypothetical protein
MQIEINERQYRALLKMVWLGNWTINAHREPDETQAEYNELEQHLMAQAHDFGQEELVQFIRDDHRFYIASEFEEELLTVVDEYDDHTFWSQLESRLTERDLMNAYGEAALETMPDDEIQERERPVLEKYMDEFDKNGIQNLVIREEKLQESQ